MKLSLFLCCVLLSILVVTSGPTFDSRLDEDWKIWKSQHEKQYTEEEETHRRSIWEDNARYIEQHNLEYSMGKRTFTMGMNEFGDLTNEEFNGRMSGLLPIDLTEEELDERDVFDEDNIRNHDLREAAFDWRDKGIVTPVKNQGQCYSCWAFSATGVLEGQVFKKTGKLIALSEQNLIDCSRSHGTFGCNGGWSLSAFDYIIENGGIEAESTYAYTAKDGESCKYNASESVASVSSYKILPYGDEEALTQAVAEIGPIAVVIDAGLPSWQFYSSGVYYDANCRSNTFNHAVLVVGYGVQSGMKYYIVKNSWGQNWGQSGYILMARGRRNSCGIASFPIYALI
ncbi:procathepsin L-like [Mustelus asterias]